MIKTVIVDDELHARETIKEMLNIYCPNVEIIGEADSVLSGLETIKKLNPELVFLDIKMDDGNGFDLLNRISDKKFSLVFLTAYDEYAVKAFKFSAIDYLLKPIDPDELEKAVFKVEEDIKKRNIKLDKLLENLESIKNDSKKIVLKTSESIFVVNIADILHCESTGNYTKFFIQNHKSVLVSKTLKEYDELLSEYGFYRVHQSHLVNLNHVMRFDKADGGVLFLNDGSNVPVSSRKKESLLDALASL